MSIFLRVNETRKKTNNEDGHNYKKNQRVTFVKFALVTSNFLSNKIQK